MEPDCDDFEVEVNGEVDGPQDRAHSTIDGQPTVRQTRILEIEITLIPSHS